jgi:hypothetical protein
MTKKDTQPDVSFKSIAHVHTWLTARSKVQIHKMIVVQLIKTFPAIYKTRRLIAAFTYSTTVENFSPSSEPIDLFQTLAPYSLSCSYFNP